MTAHTEGHLVTNGTTKLFPGVPMETQRQAYYACEQDRIDMRVELKQLHEETGGTIIYVTHDQIKALTLSSRMAVMKFGLRQQGDTLAFCGHTVPLFPALGSSPDGTAVKFAARPEEVEIVGSADEWTIPAVVESVLPMGYDSLIRVRVGTAGDSVALTVAADERTRSVNTGDQCLVRFDRDTVHCFDPQSEVRIT